MCGVVCMERTLRIMSDVQLARILPYFSAMVQRIRNRDCAVAPLLSWCVYAKDITPISVELFYAVAKLQHIFQECDSTHVYVSNRRAIPSYILLELPE